MRYPIDLVNTLSFLVCYVKKTGCILNFRLEDKICRPFRTGKITYRVNKLTYLSLALVTNLVTILLAHIFEISIEIQVSSISGSSG